MSAKKAKLSESKREFDVFNITRGALRRTPPSSSHAKCCSGKHKSCKDYSASSEAIKKAQKAKQKFFKFKEKSAQYKVKRVMKEKLFVMFEANEKKKPFLVNLSKSSSIN
jgi:hypothetical protein